MDKRRAVIILGFIFCLSIVTMGAFYVGGEVACRGGYKHGFRCVEPEILGVCVDMDGTLWVWNTEAYIDIPVNSTLVR